MIDFMDAPAVAAGGLLFIAGQIAIRADGTVPDSVEEQIDLDHPRGGRIGQANASCRNQGGGCDTHRMQRNTTTRQPVSGNPGDSPAVGERVVQCGASSAGS
ncbi:MAG: hypothetical protein JO278_16310 [Dyella sp.]|nr:hypothetical protein [Dyella sp.]